MPKYGEVVLVQPASPAADVTTRSDACILTFWKYFLFLAVNVSLVTFNGVMLPESSVASSTAVSVVIRTS